MTVKRRAQLVADVGEQRPALRLVRLEPGGHRVEATGQLADRRHARAGPPDTHRVVADLDPPGRVEQPVEIAAGFLLYGSSLRGFVRARAGRDLDRMLEVTRRVQVGDYTVRVGRRDRVCRRSVSWPEASTR